MCIYAHGCAVCFISRWGNEDGGVQVVYERRGGFFLTEGKIGALCVSSLFLTRVGVYVGVCVCIRTHTHTHCTDRVLGCKARSQDETPERPEESRFPGKRHTYIRIGVQSTHVYVYAKRQDEILH